MEQTKKVKKIFAPIMLLILALAFCGIWVAYLSPQAVNGLRVTYLSVGQGDSTLVQLPDGKTALVDGGPDRKVLEELGKRLPFYHRVIDVVFLSHPHADHLVGLIYVLKRYTVGRVVMTAEICNTPECEEFNSLIKEKEIPVTVAMEGVDFDFGSGVDMKVLYPSGQVSSENPNDSSEVLMLTYGKDDFMFTGDLESEAMGNFLKRHRDLRADVIKVPHHGSKDAYNKVLYRDLKPEFAVIPVGENKYGHPAKITLDSLKKIGVKYFRTDESGDVSFFSDGIGVKEAD